MFKDHRKYMNKYKVCQVNENSAILSQKRKVCEDGLRIWDYQGAEWGDLSNLCIGLPFASHVMKIF